MGAAAVASVARGPSTPQARLKLAIKILLLLLRQATQAPAGSVNEAALASSHQAGGCDLLFAQSDNLAAVCQCRDSIELLADEVSNQPDDDLSAHLDPPHPRGALGAANGTPEAHLQAVGMVRINQLNCNGQNLSQLQEDFDALLRLPKGPSPSRPRFQVDYLNINTNLSLSSATLGRPPDDDVDRKHRRVVVEDDRLQVDHISVQFDRKLAQFDSSSRLERQMIDLLQLINATRLQSLSMSCSVEGVLSDEAGGVSSSPGSGQLAKLNVGHLTDKLTELTRLEISLADTGIGLGLDQEALWGQTKLKWLNLASNDRLELVESIKWPSSLEFLSLESSNLRRIQLMKIFARSTFKSNGSNFVGHPSLNSLNLANNLMRSFEEDLFGFHNKSEDVIDTMGERCQMDGLSHFLLPALNQLDLSHNQLREFSLLVGQMILCSMPNLNQLYLQHNKLIHLNLNCLLSLPMPRVDSIYRNARIDQSSERSPSQSKLELLDLSYNQLIKVTAIQTSQRGAAPRALPGPGIKSINLGHNKLRRSLSLIDPKLINRIIASETFDRLDEELEFGLNLNYLEAHFELEANSTSSSFASSSFCDFVSPRATFNQDEDLLEELILNDNQIVSISSKDFSSERCKAIQVLNLSRNQIKFIDWSAFLLLNSLEQLDLSENHLTNLNEQLLSKTSKLKILSLSRNKIRQLERGIFWHLLDLEELSLSGNQLMELSAQLFHQNKRLTLLDLSNNRLSDVSSTSLADLRRLKLLNLSGNKLREFKPEVFIGSNSYNYSIQSRPPAAVPKRGLGVVMRESIKYRKSTTDRPIRSDQLVRRRNQLARRRKSQTRRRQNREVGSLVESDWGQSENVLFLSSNQLSDVKLSHHEDCKQQDPFVKQLRVLALNQNQIREIGPDAFKCLESLQTLQLQSNYIRTIDGLAFKWLTQLEHVDLADNQLVRLRPRTFSLPAQLRHVDLSRNQLSYLNPVDVFLGPTIDDESTSAPAATTTTAQTGIALEQLNLDLNPSLKLDGSNLDSFQRSAPALRTLRANSIDSIKWPRPMGHSSNRSLPSRDVTLELDLIDLSHIRRIDEQIFDILSGPTVSIKRVDLRGSLNWTGIAEDSFEAALTFLREKLKRNQINELDLGENQLGSQQVVKILNHFNSTGNEDEELSRQLTSLNLSSNRLDRWPFEVDGSARIRRYLKVLDLSGNMIKYFIRNLESSFEVPSLELLNLSSNLIVSLLDRQPANRLQLAKMMPQLKQLDLSHNRLVWLPPDLFKDLTRLKRLRLDHNQLETVSLIRQIPNSVRLLDLSSNPRLGSADGSADKLAPAGDGVFGSSEFAHLNDDFARPIDDGDDGEDDDNDLIISLHDHRPAESSSAGQPNCEPVDEFVRLSSDWDRQLGATRSALGADLMRELSSAQSQEDYQVSRRKQEHCRKLMASIRSVRLDSSLPQAASLIREPVADPDRPHSFSLRYLNLNQLPPLRLLEGVVHLDVSHNSIISIKTNSCSRTLRSLDMRQNQVEQFRSVAKHLLDCSRSLTFLDLSHNKIQSLEVDVTSGRSRLLVLRLHNNQLATVAESFVRKFKHLRLLDLRGNQLKQLALSPQRRPLLSLIMTEPRDQVLNQAPDGRLGLRIDNSSLQILAPTSPKLAKLLMSVRSAGSGSLQTYPEDRAHLIKFCSLSAKNLTEICLAQANREQLDRCLLLKLPSGVASCLTNLDEDLTRTSQHNSSSLTSAAGGHREDTFDGHEIRANQDTDPVLSFIDSLKSNWLRLRQLQLNEYLSSLSNIQPDSVWLTLTGSYGVLKIYTLTVIKCALVVVAICVIALLIAMFNLLTYLSRASDHSRGRCLGSPVASDSMAGDEPTDLTSGSTSSQLIDKTLSTSQMTDSSVVMKHSSSTSSGQSRSTTGGGSEMRTVLERNELETQATINKLDANQLLIQQMCSTPSSSLAPSSVETAETMQAVDSIQSAASAIQSQRQASVDQYAESYADFQRQQQLYPPVATVLRMVKSSSANFGEPHQDQPQPTSYRTLNPRHSDYSRTLKSKIRAIQLGQQQRQVYSTVQQPFEPLGYYYQQQQSTDTLVGGQPMDLDPTTLSLLSINTALSGNQSQVSISQEVSPQMVEVDEQQVVAPPPALNLCHYHRMRQEQPTRSAGEIIFEEGETFNGDQLLLIDEIASPPPPL